MKAAVVLALATTAAATTGCSIPDRYVQSTATVCQGEQPGYNVFGFCVSGADREEFNLGAANQVRVALDSKPNAFSFTMGGLTAPGCRIPTETDDWNTAMGASTLEPLTTSATLCDPIGAALTATDAPVKGVEIRCDAANGFFPTQGFEGSMICLDADGSAINPDTPNADDYWASGLFMPYDYSQATSAAVGMDAMQTQFTGDNALICSRGCVLPDTICANGRLNANIVGGGTGFSEGTCTLRPNRANVFETSFSFRCASGRTFGNLFTATCVSPATTATITGFNNQCGLVDGAQSVPLWNFDNRLDAWATTMTQAAGEIHDEEFPLVTSTLALAFNVNAAAYATIMMHRGWNNNPVQALRNGAVYQITVTGCDAFTGDARRRCVQHVLNYWRCEVDFPFNGGTICYADRTEIACPTHELGFRCPSSSKKGLWGLLGLLGIIPIVLLCCSLLFLCCIRRRKTEADVHFATFDPHAAPVMATQPVATTCNGFTGTPFTHPSAVPVL